MCVCVYVRGRVKKRGEREKGQRLLRGEKRRTERERERNGVGVRVRERNIASFLHCLLLGPRSIKKFLFLFFN